MKCWDVRKDTRINGQSQKVNLLKTIFRSLCSYVWADFLVSWPFVGWPFLPVSIWTLPRVQVWSEVYCHSEGQFWRYFKDFNLRPCFTCCDAERYFGRVSLCWVLRCLCTNSILKFSSLFIWLHERKCPHVQAHHSKPFSANIKFIRELPPP